MIWAIYDKKNTNVKLAQIPAIPHCSRDRFPPDLLGSPTEGNDGDFACAYNTTLPDLHYMIGLCMAPSEATILSKTPSV